MDKILVLYTMKGCPWCDLMKKKLNEENITYHDRDISKHAEEYKEFVKITNSEFIPAFIYIENKKPEPVNYFYVPDRDFDTIDKGVDIIKEHLSRN